jgi:hypothetical protein
MVENGGWWSNMHTAISGDYPFRLGEDFTGKLDNFRVYDRVLTEIEIYELFITRQ